MSTIFCRFQIKNLVKRVFVKCHRFGKDSLHIFRKWLYTVSVLITEKLYVYLQGFSTENIYDNFKKFPIVSNTERNFYSILIIFSSIMNFSSTYFRLSRPESWPLEIHRFHGNIRISYRFPIFKIYIMIVIKLLSPSAWCIFRRVLTRNILFRKFNRPTRAQTDYLLVNPDQRAITDEWNGR